MKKVSSIAATTLALLSVGLAIYAHEALACSLVGYSDFERIEKDIYVAPATSVEERKQLLSLIAAAKHRVAATYAQLAATPVIIAARRMDSLQWFSANEYASTHFLPGQAYMVIGPKGHNVDVIAHELVHAGIFAHAGYWARTVDIPVWFDEGVAMQVDYRKKYDLPVTQEKSPALDGLRYSWQFFNGDDSELTHHYAVSKAEVQRWLIKAGDGSVQSLLKEVKSGADFDETYRKMRGNES
jgi:hypothetical protein